MHDDLKLETRDKVLQKMSRNGAVEQNVSRGTDKNISKRIEEITFEKNSEPGSDIEFGRGAKEARRGGNGDQRSGRHNRGYGQENHTDVGQSESNASTPYNDHEAYLDSLLREVGVDTDSSKSHHSPKYRYKNGAERITDNSHTKLLNSEKSASANSDFEDKNNRTTETYESDQAQESKEDTAFLEHENTALHDKGPSSYQIDPDRGVGKGLTEKAAYKKRIKQTSSRQNYIYEKKNGKKTPLSGENEGSPLDSSKREQNGKTTGAKKTQALISKRQKTEAVLKPFSGAADKLKQTVSENAHEKVHESEDDNSSVQAAHETEIQAENVLKAVRRKAANRRKGRLRFDDSDFADTEPKADAGKRALKTKAVKKGDDEAVKKVGKAQVNGSAEGKNTNSPHLKFSSNRSVNVLNADKVSSSDKSSVLVSRQDSKRLHFGKRSNEDADKKVNAVKKQMQKKHIKREYAAALRAEKNGTAAGTKTVEKAADVFKQGAGKLKDILAGVIKKNYGALIVLGVVLIVYLMFLSASGTVISMFSEAGESFVGSTYLSTDDDITDNDSSYEELEDELQDQIDNIETDYPGYDEYRYQVDEISHDPYSLASYFTAIYGNFKASDVEPELLALFQEQYTLTINEVIETKTRTVTDPDTGEESEEEYDWYVLEVTLTNKGIDEVAMAHMNDNQKMLYGAYMVSKGNRSYLFGEDPLPGNVAGGGLSYDIPPEALEDEAFARMINEAEKYLGMAYVWGGSNPDSGFDCSGFVSWVINHSGNGWNVGRSTANGLMGHCTHVSSSEAKPGDLIFFQKTYNTSGASHVGIYVGDGMMIHCGNPIQYTSINSNYWQNHFLGFGRISD